jgi:hypothetical protein
MCEGCTADVDVTCNACVKDVQQMWMLHVVMCEGCTADVDVTCSDV